MIYRMEQGSAEWLAARRGRITASRMADVVNYLAKGGEGAKRKDYRLDLIAERLTGLCETSFVSSEMQWGIDQEQYARARYEIENDVIVDRVGFITHPAMEFSGGSPDGLVTGNGGVEFKAPKTTTHIEWLSGGVIPEKHLPQVDWNIACGELDWMDFVSFDPRIINRDLQVFKVRRYRDDKRIAELESEVARFNDEIEAQIAKMGKTLTEQLRESLHANQ
jgi:hypothetical protein